MTKTFRVKLVKDILMKDSNVREILVNENGVAFWTYDLVSEEEVEYSFDCFEGLATETVQCLKKIGIDVDKKLQFNDCQGYENEGCVFI